MINFETRPATARAIRTSFGQASRSTSVWAGGLAFFFACLFGGMTAAADASTTGTLPVDSIDGRLPPMQVIDPGGEHRTDVDLQPGRMVVLAFLGTECPLAKLYAVRLQAIADDRDDVDIVGVYSNTQDSLEEIAAMQQQSKLTFMLGKDPGAMMARAVGATRTPEVFVYGPNRRLRYHGRIDDQYGIGYVRKQPQQNDLKSALEAIARGEDPVEAHVPAVGCLIGIPKPIAAKATVEYHRDVAPILARHCVDCHREGEIGPFVLDDYDTASGFADMMVQTIDEGRMPPWHADPNHGVFANQRRMTETEISTLRQWAADGTPQGVAMRTNQDGQPNSDDSMADSDGPSRLWQFGRKPDLTGAITEQPVRIAATGALPYRYYRVPLHNDHDLWMTAAQLRPGNRSVVHHILCFAVAEGTDRGVDGGGVDGYLAGYVPGSRVEPYPPGYAKRIDAHSDLIFQVHYTPTGSPQTDQSHFGLLLTDADSVTHEVTTRSAPQLLLRIPPGQPDYETYAVSAPLPPGAELLSMSPHMHVRGRSFRYELQSPDGEMRTLLNIPEFDFNWQTNYVLAEPIVMAGGERMVCTAVFDNSQDNPANPDPNATVRWGDQTWDEMMIGYFDYATQRSHGGSGNNMTEIMQRLRLYRRFDALDIDNDGRVHRQATPQTAWKVFDRLDRNEDQVVTRQEAILNAITNKISKQPQ